MRYNILLIEDNAETADNISSILELARYNVIHAPNGKNGVDLAQRMSPDLILCDVMMPDLDGYGVLHILHKRPETAGIPFIFLTGKADFRAGMNLGADDCITKPFDEIDLLKVVEMRLQRSELLKRILCNNPSATNAFFSKSLEFSHVQKLAENRPARSFRKKDLIFMQGETPKELYLIEKGQVKTYKLNEAGKELITGIHKEGDFMGFIPLLEDKVYNDNAEALEDARISFIPKRDFITLLYSSKDIARKFIEMLSSNVEEMENRLLDIAYQPVRQRVAKTLLNMSGRLGQSRNDGIITIGRREISSIVGTAMESVNRTLCNFKDEGLIDFTSHGLKILNRAKLENLIKQSS
ncbi:MAG TPA: response regulator [Chryseosolibacter sp.]|nr:response regulator [Chryseosolibacter sp.]